VIQKLRPMLLSQMAASALGSCGRVAKKASSTLAEWQFNATWRWGHRPAREGCRSEEDRSR
jgi:hypothetical protein